MFRDHTKKFHSDTRVNIFFAQPTYVLWVVKLCHPGLLRVDSWAHGLTKTRPPTGAYGHRGGIGGPRHWGVSSPKYPLRQRHGVRVDHSESAVCLSVVLGSLPPRNYWMLRREDVDRLGLRTDQPLTECLLGPGQRALDVVWRGTSQARGIALQHIAE